MKTQSTPPSDVVDEEVETVIDTSKMSKGQRDALEMTEAARDKVEKKLSFSSSLFMGSPNLEQIYPFPEEEEEDIASGAQFFKRLKYILDEHVDADEIDETGEIPDDLIKRLAEIKAFAIKVPRRYGGLGLTQANYSKAAMLLGAKCGSLTALISAHQSIGVPQPLILYGTDEQKRKYLPRFAKGEISAFALTEDSVGSDPSKMETVATATADGNHYVLNGEKLWCTNGTKAGVLVVMARTPNKIINGKEKKQITAFIVETDSPGVRVKHRCRFMGLKALYNGVMTFKDVKIPKENIILGDGKGLKVALSTLNTGRLTLPAACTGMLKECLKICKDWSNQRRQWGASIGKHAAIAEKISRMAADLFAMESMVLLTSSLVDRKNIDIRLEAAMCKMWGTEVAWKHVDETMQIRGGRGYETASSLRDRGEAPIPVERFMRDCRINMIFEGSSEIMRLFLAREALDPHLNVAGEVLNSQVPLWKRFTAAIKAGIFYAKWYPKMWMPTIGGVPHGMDPRLKHGMKYVLKRSKKLSRSLFHAMVRFGPALEKQQPLLGRFVEIGTELFVITASILRADRMLRRTKDGVEHKKVIRMVNYIIAEAKMRIDDKTKRISSNNDKETYAFAQSILKE